MSPDKERPSTALAPDTFRRNLAQIVIASALAAPAPVIRALEVADVAHLGLPSLAESLLFGAAIFAAATLLVWTSEVAEQMISATLALALLAIIAVLPEYAVDLYFAWTAPTIPENAHFALANMTGANRLLVGFAWPLVFFLFWLQRRRQGVRNAQLEVGAQNSVPLVFLAIATIYSFSIPARGHLSLIDAGFLITLFAVYIYLSSRTPPADEVPLVGPAQSIAALPARGRWAAVVALFVFAAGTVFAAAEPFANGLVDTGESLGISKFLLVQWVAPLASESPEFILAAILALRARAQAGLTVLLSSKVNQWTLLVGSLPLVYAISDGSFAPLDFDSRQVEEVFLTASQSLFAVAILTSLSLSFREAALMLGLFLGQFIFPQSEVRWGFAVVYLVLSIGWFASERSAIGRLFGAARREIAAAGMQGSSPPRPGEDATRRDLQPGGR